MQFNPFPQVLTAVQEFPEFWKKAGETIEITQGSEKEVLTITKVESAKERALSFKINLSHDIPVYHVEEISRNRDAMYLNLATEKGEYIIMRSVATDFELRHELIHALLSTKDATPELLELYQKIKAGISESSFSNAESVNFNYMRSLDECIVDGYNHPWFISALKKEGLYDEFLAVTKYLDIIK